MNGLRRFEGRRDLLSWNILQQALDFSVRLPIDRRILARALGTFTGKAESPHGTELLHMMKRIDTPTAR